MKKKNIIMILISLFVVSLIGFTIYTIRENKSADNAKVTDKRQEKSDESVEKISEDVQNKQDEELKSIEGSKVSSEDEAKELIKKLIGIMYFNEENYDNYKELFVFQDKIMSEEKFNNFRENRNTKIKETFGKEFTDVSEIIKLMNISKENKFTIVEYKLEGQSSAPLKWQVINKDGKSYIYNAMISK